jgi:putative flippase GtrA
MTVACTQMIERVAELTRFCAVGLLCFAVGLAVLVGLCELAGLDYLLAYAASFVIANGLGYLLNGRFTFAGRAKVDGPGVLRYMLVNGALLAVNSMLLKLMVERLHVWYLSGTFILAAINMPISFVVHRLVSYRLHRRIRVATTAPADRA